MDVKLNSQKWTCASIPDQIGALRYRNYGRYAKPSLLCFLTQRPEQSLYNVHRCQVEFVNGHGINLTSLQNIYHFLKKRGK